MKEETVKAFDQLRRALATHLGVDPSELTLMVSRPHDELPNVNAFCTRCRELYYDESGCDPCPHCGASYFDQIFPGWFRIPRLPRLKRRRRAARRAALKRRAH
ncbi:MAG TPA: hypothetical protein VF659_09210 [Pyrinomonadaceae bacterium]|jgi:hypothetical protein